MRRLGDQAAQRKIIGAEGPVSERDRHRSRRGEAEACRHSAAGTLAAMTSPAVDAIPQVAHGAKADHAYDAIRVKILDGSYGPGFRLVLDRLANEIGVSAVPVREALRRLEAEGYVDFIRNVGARVRWIDVTDYAESLQTLAVLEASATAIAAPLLTKSALAQARKANDAMVASLARRDGAAVIEQDGKFHERLVAACPNSYLVGMVRREMARVQRLGNALQALAPERAQQAVDEHARLIELIENGARASRIEDMARAHRERTAELLVSRYGGWPARSAAVR
jgi:DNA-binding GntR family transcriptional regulator